MNDADYWHYSDEYPDMYGEEDQDYWTESETSVNIKTALLFYFVVVAHIVVIVGAVVIW